MPVNTMGKLVPLCLIVLLYSLSRTYAYSVKASAPVITCYWESWSVYRTGIAAFPVQKIPASQCTHLLYAFAGLDPATYRIKSLDPWCDLSSSEGGGLDNYRNAVGLKSVNPYLKVLLSVGGWNEGSETYSQMASSSTTRKIFVDSALGLLTKYGFDGLDMDWEYPTQRGGGPQDKKNFVLLLQDLQEAFAPYGLILTAAVSGSKSTIDSAYDVPEVTKYVDYLNVMSYEYHSYYDDPEVRHQSPMASKPDEDPALNVNWTLNYYITLGAPPAKLLLGIVTDARTYTLASPEMHNVGDLSVGPGAIGPYTQSVGYLSTYEVCSYLHNGWDTVYDTDYQAPYSYGGNQWAAYDNPESAAVKAQFAKSTGLGGIMLWSVDMDDCMQICSGNFGCYILNSIYQTLNEK